MIEREEMEAVLEAVLFVAQEPVRVEKLLEIFPERQRQRAAEALDAVRERFRAEAGRGVQLDEVAGGLRLVTRPELHAYLRRFFEVSGKNKLTMAALETLAIIAYRQPVTAPEIQELRGVNSSGVIKKLLERRLVRIAGRKEVVGKPFLYATTREFLIHFGLSRLQELPSLEQFEELFGGEEDSPEEEIGHDHEETVLREAASLEEAAEDSAASEDGDGAEAAEVASETGGDGAAAVPAAEGHDLGDWVPEGALVTAADAPPAAPPPGEGEALGLDVPGAEQQAPENAAEETALATAEAVPEVPEP